MIDRQSGVPIALGLRTPLTSLIQTLAVAEHLSFCRAANALAVSQSSVSARNKALEEEPGIVLFERNAGGVRFTEAGRLFVERVSAGVDHLDHAAKSARMAALGECGRLRIGVHGLIPRSFLADTIKVGILHSLSGTMAISETTLKDVMLILIEEQNKKGGCSARSWKRSSSTRPRTGRCSPRRRAS
jgi:hypothetical protein